MTRIFKSNKFISSLIIILCIFFIFNPKSCSNSILNASSVLFFNILPIMFPFFVLTRIMISISEFNSGFADKFFNKTYNSPSGSLKIFLLSAISGYPMGAKLICSFYNQGNLNNRQAESLMALCSVCGPTFILGTVGVSILKSYKAGIIILIANVLSALVNGLIFKNKKENLNMKPCIHKKSDFSLSDIVYDSLLSILMIAGFVCLSTYGFYHPINYIVDLVKIPI